MMAAGNYTSHADARGSEGNQSSEPPRYLAVGRILRPWGIKGMVKVEVMTDFPERFAQTDTFYVGDDHRPVQLKRSAGHTGSLLLKFAGYETPEACSELRDQILYIPIEEAMPLPDGEYYIYQMLGLEVWTDAGERLGTLTDVWETGANDVYVVDVKGESVLLPAIPDVILDVNLEQKRITVHLLEGLMS
jgi:16S rRNA processing protein RimM